MSHDTVPEDVDSVDDSTPQRAPAEFIDLAGRTWRLELTFGLAKRVRTASGLDFVNYHDGKALLAMRRDIEKLVQALWLLCETRAEELGVDEEAFGESLGGDTIEAATQALEECLINFSQPDLRPALRAIQTEAKTTQKKNTFAIVRKVSSPEFQKRIDDKITKTMTELDKQLDKL